MSVGRQLTDNLKLQRGGQLRPARLFCVWNYMDWGGAQVYFLALMKEAVKHCEVSAVMPSGTSQQLQKLFHDLGVRCENVDARTDSQPARTLKRKLERHYNKLRSEYIFCRYLKSKDLKNSIVHTEFAPWQSFAALFWLCLRTKVFVTVHNSIRPPQRWRRLIWRAKFGVLSRMKNFHVFTANEDAKKSLRNYVPEKFYHSIKVTYASINPELMLRAQEIEIDKPALKRKFDIPADKFLVLCVGQFIDRKGRWVFLEAARELAIKNSDIAFVWISNSKPSADEMQKADSFGLGENFRLITSDQIGGDRLDLFSLYRLADVFALPSFVEGLPISLLEAMALGLASVSTRINGIPEAVKHLETGWLIDPGSSAELVRAVQTLKDDKNLREKLAREGSLSVLKNFDETVAAQTAWKSYKESFAE